MSTWRFLVNVLLLIHPALSQIITSTCEIPSVEAGENATLTIHFGQNLRQERERDFYLEHIVHSSTASQKRLLNCEFSYGNVTCKETTCCTWESHVTNVFRVYIHNVSQELEGRFWGFVIPASTDYQKSCNFSLKAFSCPTDSINATNSHTTCSNPTVTLCQTCTVTCNHGYHFKEDHNSVTYTCVGKKKWFPENPLTSCEAYTCPTDFINASNSHMKCSKQPVTIGETCIVTCNPDHYFKENQTSVTYKCVGKNKWSPEIPVTSCKDFSEQSKVQEARGLYFLLLLLIVFPIAIVIFIFFIRQARKREQIQKDVKELLLSELKELKFLRKCLGAKNVDDAVKLCLLKDQLSDNQTPSDINHSSLQTLREWWQHIRAPRSESLLTSSLYKQLVARFCGPATTVEVHCVTAPRLKIRTLGEAVSETGERVARLVLFPQQVEILNQLPSRAFLSGPPGTGKTIVLIMQGLTWIQRGYDIHVVSTCYESRAATIVIEHQLQETAKTSTAMSRVHRHQFDFSKDGDVEAAVSFLKSLSEGRQLCVIADEVVRNDRKPFTEFCDQLIKEVPEVFIWGASLYHDVRPLCLKEFKLTTPLRSPPVVIREVMEAEEIKDKQVDDYTVSDIPVPTDGPPVMRIKHRDGQSGHTERLPHDCIECGHQVARVLTEFNVGRTGHSNGPPPLQYLDVLVLCEYYPTDDRVDSDGQVITTASGLVQGLRARHVPVRVVKEGDEAAIRDTALGVGNLVTVANWFDVQGLERKVVVVERGVDVFDRLHAMSRCTSQLVLIDC